MNSWHKRVVKPAISVAQSTQVRAIANNQSPFPEMTSLDVAKQQVLTRRLFRRVRSGKDSNPYGRRPSASSARIDVDTTRWRSNPQRSHEASRTVGTTHRRTEGQRRGQSHAQHRLPEAGEDKQRVDFSESRCNRDGLRATGLRAQPNRISNIQFLPNRPVMSRTARRGPGTRGWFWEEPGGWGCAVKRYLLLASCRFRLVFARTECPCGGFEYAGAQTAGFPWIGQGSIAVADSVPRLGRWQGGDLGIRFDPPGLERRGTLLLGGEGGNSVAGLWHRGIVKAVTGRFSRSPE